MRIAAFLMLCLMVVALPTLADIPYVPIYANFEKNPSEAQWSIEIKQASSPRIRCYLYQGTSVWDATGWTATFQYGKNDSATGMYCVTGTVSSTYVDFPLASTSMPNPFDKWYSTVLVSSGAVDVCQACGLLTVKRSPELTAGNIAYAPYLIQGGKYTFSGSFSNWPFISRSSSTGTTVATSFGDLMYFTGTNWVRLPVGTSGYTLLSGGSATAPAWSSLVSYATVFGTNIWTSTNTASAAWYFNNGLYLHGTNAEPVLFMAAYTNARQDAGLTALSSTNETQFTHITLNSNWVVNASNLAAQAQAGVNLNSNWIGNASSLVVIAQGGVNWASNALGAVASTNEIQNSFLSWSSNALVALATTNVTQNDFLGWSSNALAALAGTNVVQNDFLSWSSNALSALAGTNVNQNNGIEGLRGSNVAHYAAVGTTAHAGMLTNYQANVFLTNGTVNALQGFNAIFGSGLSIYDITNSSDTVSLGGNIQLGYSQGGTQRMETQDGLGGFLSGNIQQLYNYGGTARITNASCVIQNVFTEMPGANALIESGAHGSVQLLYMYGEGARATIKTNAYNAIQIGYLHTGATVTNQGGENCIQLFNLGGNEHAQAWEGARASIGIGACTLSNEETIVIGDGQVSHGDGTLTVGKGGLYLSNSLLATPTTINLYTNLIPLVSNVYDIGSVAMPIHDLHMEGSSIYMKGSNVFGYDGTNINLSAPVTINGGSSMPDSDVIVTNNYGATFTNTSFYSLTIGQQRGTNYALATDKLSAATNADVAANADTASTATTLVGIVTSQIVTNNYGTLTGRVTVASNADTAWVASNVINTVSAATNVTGASQTPYVLPYGTTQTISALNGNYQVLWDITNTVDIYVDTSASTNQGHSIRLDIVCGTNAINLATATNYMYYTTNLTIGIGSSDIQLRGATDTSTLLFDKAKYNSKWRLWSL